MSTTVCPKCGEIKTEENTSRKKSGRFQAYCKSCTNVVNAKYYEDNREKHCKYVSDKKREKRKPHTCKMCGKSEPEVSFYFRKKESKKGTPRFICRNCDIIYRQKYPTSLDSKKRARQNTKKKESLHRQIPEFFPKFVLKDSKTSDSKKNLENDLDLEFVTIKLMECCSYCGNNDARKTLDRIDNSLGHLKSNVNTSCRRCNWFRRDMPFNAWIRIAPVMKEIQKANMLFRVACRPKES